MTKIITEYYKITNKWATGTEYGPLLSNGIDFLCPDCGSYGFISNDICLYCNGKGQIELDDKRVVDSKEV